MKKIFTIVLTLALLAIGTSAVLAADLTDEELIAERHAEMVAEKTEWLSELVAQGIITQEEADEFLANMEARYLESDGIYLGIGANEDAGMYRGGRNDEERGNEDGLLLNQNLNEDGVLHQYLDNDSTAPGAMGRGNGQSNGFGQSSTFDGDCILD